ncbi:MAG: SLC13 family permease [Pyrinomonadaceae bacterium]|nr:SLC13 family permease [Pyrinomonadaceae bacterium]
MNELEAVLTAQNLKMAATIIILFAAIYSFVREKIPADLTALLAVLGLLLTGVLTPGEAFAGFSHPATVAVAAVLILSAAIEKTGALSFLARRVLLPLGHSEILLTAAVMLVIGALSAFVNNTAAVAVFIPIVLDVCRRTNISPGRVLMPMSHAATIGGMCTLVGTSTNLVAHEYARANGLAGFSMFELGKIGLPMIVVGYAYMLFVGRLFLPKNESTELTATDKTEDYLAEFIVTEDSAWKNRNIDAKKLANDFDIELTEVFRTETELNLDEADRNYAAADSLRVRGTLDNIFKLWSGGGLVFYRPGVQTSADDEDNLLEAVASENKTRATFKDGGKLAEVVVLPPSGLIGRTLKETRFAERYDAVVLALRRRGAARGRPSTTPLHAGDVLVVEGASEALRALADSQSFLVIGDVPRPEQASGKVLITLLTLLGVMTLVVSGFVPIVTAAVAGCAVLVLTKCLRLRELYGAINLSIVFLLAGSLALGAALDKSGITQIIADGLSHLHGAASPFVIVAVFLFAAIIISEFMSNSGTVPLLAPIAISVAAKTGLEPMALIAAITFGSTAAFAMPIGYQTSLMIYGGGGYRVKDFVRMGIVLDVLLAILALILIPYFWQLTR